MAYSDILNTGKVFMFGEITSTIDGKEIPLREITMNKIRILQFPIANTKGGMTHYALNNWKWLDKEKFQCDFVTMNKKLDFESEVTNTGSKIYHMSCYAEENKEQFVKEFGEILDNKYDIVHLHTKQWKSFLMEDICKKKHVNRVIVHSHNTGIDTWDECKRSAEVQLHEEVKKRFNESVATDFWACSYLAADFLFGKQISKEKIKIMPNAIELDEFAYNESIRNQYRKKYGLEKCFVIGHVGRFAYQKNHEFLIDVFNEASKEIKNLKLILLGDGELASAVQRKVKKLELEDKVLFLGKRDDINKWYSVMDVFCLPSRFEGLPIAMIEAQAAGLPCIGSDHITEEVQICDNVFLFPLIVEVWKNKITEIIGTKREENQLKLIQNGYDIKIQIKCIEKEYMSGKV